MSAPKHLLFAVESIGRDLDPLLALAVKTARPDNRVYIGSHPALMRLARRVRGGVYLGAAPTRRGAEQGLNDYRKLKQRGFVVVHFDGASPGYIGDGPRWQTTVCQRLDPHQLDENDYICTWGDFQRDVYRRQQPGCENNIRTTGHPGLELVRGRWRRFYTPRAEELRMRFGHFLLVTTNAAGANRSPGANSPFGPGDDAGALRLDRRIRQVTSWAYNNRHLSHLVRLVHRLHVVFPDVAVVVRPHRREDPQFYRRAFRGLDTIYVSHQGAVAPWVLACRCLIHSGGSPGLQAHLGETPAIHFQPVDEPNQQPFLPGQFGVRCEHEDAVVDSLVELMHSEAPRTRFDDPCLVDHRARRLLNNLCDPSFPAMLSVLAEAQSQIEHTDGPGDLMLSVGQAVAGAVQQFRQLLDRRDGGATGIEADDVAERLDRLQRLADQSVDHRVIANGVVVVEAS